MHQKFYHLISDVAQSQKCVCKTRFAVTSLSFFSNCRGRVVTLVPMKHYLVISIYYKSIRIVLQKTISYIIYLIFNC